MGWWHVDNAGTATCEASVRHGSVACVPTSRCKSCWRRSTMLMGAPFAIDAPTKASWDISVTAEGTCSCTVTVLFPPLPHQTRHGRRGREESRMTARGTRSTVGLMSRTAQCKTPCVESGTHPDEVYHLGAQSHVRVSFDI